jgi:D-alanine-D-alanine ligase
MTKVLVLIGGISNEREVSLMGAAAVVAGLRQNYDAVPYDFIGDISALADAIRREKPDAVFNGLHGTFGEDGRMQGLLDFFGVPYTHSPFISSAVCMNKFYANAILARYGIKVPENRLVSREDFARGGIMPLPYVMKPVNDGSSVGVHICKDRPLEAWPYDFDVAMVERYIEGREFTVAIFAGKALAITEIVPNHAEFYDYAQKYSKDGARHILPADLPEAEADKVKKIAEDSYMILGCRGAARIDIRHDGKDFYVLEMNTQPGMTPFSLLPEQAKYAGIEFPDLLKMIEAEAMMRARMLKK